MNNLQIVVRLRHQGGYYTYKRNNRELKRFPATEDGKMQALALISRINKRIPDYLEKKYDGYFVAWWHTAFPAGCNVWTGERQ